MVFPVGLPVAAAVASGSDAASGLAARTGGVHTDAPGDGVKTVIGSVQPLRASSIRTAPAANIRRISIPLSSVDGSPGGNQTQQGLAAVLPARGRRVHASGLGEYWPCG